MRFCAFLVRPSYCHLSLVLARALSPLSRVLYQNTKSHFLCSALFHTLHSNQSRRGQLEDDMLHHSKPRGGLARSVSKTWSVLSTTSTQHEHETDVSAYGRKQQMRFTHCQVKIDRQEGDQIRRYPIIWDKTTCTHDFRVSVEVGKVMNPNLYTLFVFMYIIRIMSKSDI